MSDVKAARNGNPPPKTVQMHQIKVTTYDKTVLLTLDDVVLPLFYPDPTSPSQAKLNDEFHYVMGRKLTKQCREKWKLFQKGMYHKSYLHVSPRQYRRITRRLQKLGEHQ